MGLSRSEEADLAARAKAGDEEAARLLVFAVTPYLWRRVNAAALRYHALDPAQAASDAFLALSRSLRHYDPARSRWCTYAATAIHRAVARVARDAVARAARFPVPALPDEADPDLVARDDPDGDPPLIDLIRQAIQTLDPLSRSVLEAAYGIDRPRLALCRIARHHGIATRRVKGVVAEALRTLRTRAGIQLEERT